MRTAPMRKSRNVGVGSAIMTWTTTNPIACLLGSEAMTNCRGRIRAIAPELRKERFSCLLGAPNKHQALVEDPVTSVVDTCFPVFYPSLPRAVPSIREAPSSCHRLTKYLYLLLLCVHSGSCSSEIVLVIKRMVKRESINVQFELPSGSRDHEIKAGSNLRGEMIRLDVPVRLGDAHFRLFDVHCVGGVTTHYNVPACGTDWLLASMPAAVGSRPDSTAT